MIEQKGCRRRCGVQQADSEKWHPKLINSGCYRGVTGRECCVLFKQRDYYYVVCYFAFYLGTTTSLATLNPPARMGTR
jgi:hypothetical protein